MSQTFVQGKAISEVIKASFLHTVTNMFFQPSVHHYFHTCRLCHVGRYKKDHSLHSGTCMVIFHHHGVDGYKYGQSMYSIFKTWWKKIQNLRAVIYKFLLLLFFASNTALTQIKSFFFLILIRTRRHIPSSSCHKVRKNRNDWKYIHYRVMIRAPLQAAWSVSSFWAALCVLYIFYIVFFQHF